MTQPADLAEAGFSFHAPIKKAPGTSGTIARMCRPAPTHASLLVFPPIGRTSLEARPEWRDFCF
jgi:hypothetical protein